MARILIACEESQTITKAFREAGHECYSCDLKPAKINPDWHFQGDIFELIEREREFELLIAHPPCTYLTVTRNKWFKPEFDSRFPTQHKDREDAVEFFMKLANLPINRIAIENPIGIMSTRWRPADQVIHPWHFGDPERKATCLWLKNLPKLVWTKQDNLFETKTAVEPDIVHLKNGGTMSRYHYDSVRLSAYERSEVRSKTFPGIASAIVSQWGPLLP